MNRLSRTLTSIALVLACAAPFAAAEDAAPTRDELAKAARAAPEAEQPARWRALARHLETNGEWLDGAYAWHQAFTRTKDVADAEGEARCSLSFAEQVLVDGEAGAATKASFADAETALRRARDAGASADWIGVGLARCADALGRTDEQIDLLRGVCSARPESLAAHRALAFALYHAQRDAEAVPAFQAAAALPGQSTAELVPLYLTESASARRAGRAEVALAAAERVITLSPTDDRGWLAVWQVFAEDKRFTELADVLATKATAHPDSGPAAHYTGFACSYAERWDDAERWLGRAVEIAPHNVTALLELARILRDVRNRRDEAVALYEAVLELDPANDPAVAALLYIAARISDGEGRPEKAVPLFTAIVKARPDDPTHRANLALALRWSGRSEESRREYAKAEELAPYDTQVRNDHGLLLLVMGLDDAARERFLDGHAVDERHNDAVENLAFMARERGDLTEAETWFHVGWKAALKRGEDGARHRRNLDDVRFPLPPLR